MGEVFDVRTGKQVSGLARRRLKPGKFAGIAGAPPDLRRVQPEETSTAEPTVKASSIEPRSPIKRAAVAITEAGFILECCREENSTPNPLYLKVMLRDMNSQLEALGPAEQEAAWEQAGKILDQ